MLRFCSRKSWDKVFPCKLPFRFHPPIWWGSQDAFQKVQWRCLSLLPQCLLLFVTIPCQVLNAAWLFFLSSGTSTYLLLWKYCIVHFEVGGKWHFDHYTKQNMGCTTRFSNCSCCYCRELLQKSLTGTNVFNFIVIQMLHTSLVPILISIWHHRCRAVHTRIEHRPANPSWGLCWDQPQGACSLQINVIWSTAYRVQKLCDLSNVVQGLKSMGDFPWISSGVGSIQQWIKNRT